MNFTPPPNAKERSKALDLALQQIEKQFGKGAIMKLGEGNAVPEIEVTSTGSIGLDLALGVGGVPRGRVIEIYGPESSGKTTLALTIIANAQKTGGNAVFIDAEHALDSSYAGKLGVDIANLHVAQPDTGEEALEIADTLVRSGAVDIVVIDSVAALVPRAEIEGEMGDSHVGLQARLMSQALRKLTGSINKSRTCVIFINQIRMQIGVMFGNPETTAGGRALKFYASVRLDIRRIQTLKEGETAVGNRTKVKVVKNKVAAPFREAEFDILYNEGISREGELIDFAVDKLVISKAGTWFSFGDERLGQGRENTRMFLKEHADIRAKIEAKVLPMLGLKAPGVAASVNGSTPEAAKAPGAPGAPGVQPAKAVSVPGMQPAKPVAVPSAAERRK
jgi:recombination protein RecA